MNRPWIPLASIACALACGSSNTDKPQPAPAPPPPAVAKAKPQTVAPVVAPLVLVDATRTSGPTDVRPLGDLGKPVTQGKPVRLDRVVTTPRRLVVQWVDTREAGLVDPLTGPLAAYPGELSLGPNLWIHHGGTLDTPLSLTTGQEIDILMMMPNGDATNDRMRVLADPNHPVVLVATERDGKALLGVWSPDKNEVAMTGTAPFALDTMLVVGADALYSSRDRLRDEKPGCGWLKLEGGNARCAVDVMVPLADQTPLAGWMALTPEGAPVQLAAFGGGAPFDALPKSLGCTSERLITHLEQPPRLLIECEAATPIIALWSPETIWTAPVPEGLENSGPNAVLGLGDAGTPRTRWLDLPSGRLVTTPPLQSVRYNGVPDGFYALTEDSHLVQVDMKATTVIDRGLVACDGSLAFDTANHPILHCYKSPTDDKGATNTWSELLTPTARLHSERHAEAYQDGLAVLSDTTDRNMSATASSLWVVDVPAGAPAP